MSDSYAEPEPEPPAADNDSVEVGDEETDYLVKDDEKAEPTVRPDALPRSPLSCVIPARCARESDPKALASWAQAPMLPSGFTSAHLLLEVLSLGVALYLTNLTYLAWRFYDPKYVTESGDEAVTASQLQYATYIFLYAGFSIFIVVATSIATISGCRIFCCGCCQKQDCCGDTTAAGHKTYFISILTSLTMSCIEIFVLLGHHAKVEREGCDYGCGSPSTGDCTGLPMGTGTSAMEVELMHNILGLASGADFVSSFSCCCCSCSCCCCSCSSIYRSFRSLRCSLSPLSSRSRLGDDQVLLPSNGPLWSAAAGVLPIEEALHEDPDHGAETGRALASPLPLSRACLGN